MTFSVLGGLFWLTLGAAVLIMATNAPGEGETWSPFLLSVAIVGLVLIVLLATSKYAREFAAENLEAEINTFVKEPLNSRVNVSNEERRLVAEVTSQKYFMERESFIPTFRRMDYRFKVQTGQEYLLILIMGWSGIPNISFSHVDSL